MRGDASVPHHEFGDGADCSQYKTVAWAPHDVQEINDLILESDSMDQCVARSAGNLTSRLKILLF
ncbi:MAG: hypothetical protein ACJATP_000608 [Candidatus Azotimanducaceae bacterium]|jgi:hypothetical protein